MADNIASSGESDVSENEDLARLKEAANNEFINDSMFNKDLKDKNRLENSCVNRLEDDGIYKSLPVSLRHQEHHDNVLQVTPEFQKFVSKHLAQVIESQLKEKRSKKSVKLKQDPTGGVKLFSDSTEYLSLTSQTETSRPTRRPKPKRLKREKDSSSGSEEERSRFSEVAVTSDWVLGQESTKGWNKSCKGKEIIVNSKGNIVHEKN